jgi:four helix bundle protein
LNIEGILSILYKLMERSDSTNIQFSIVNIQYWREGGMDDLELKQRTKEFGHRCVKLALELPNGQLGKHISGQLIRCSTSVAANYRASCIAQSKASFISKLSIVLEESDESSFWFGIHY